MKALDEVYKIDTLVHRSAFKNSAKFRQTFSRVESLFSKYCVFLTNMISPILNIIDVFSEIQQFVRKISTSPRFSPIPWDFVTNSF